MTRNHSLTDPLPYRSPSPLQHTPHTIHLKRSYSSPEEPRDLLAPPAENGGSGSVTPTVSITNSTSEFTSNVIEGYSVQASLGDEVIEDDDPIEAEQTSTEYPMKRHRSWDIINGSPLTNPPKPVVHPERERRGPHERKLSKSKSTLNVTRNHSLTDPLPFPLSQQKTTLPYPPFPIQRPSSYNYHPLDLTPLTNALPIHLMQLNSPSHSNSNNSTPENTVTNNSNTNSNAFASSNPQKTSLEDENKSSDQVILPPFRLLDIETKRHYHPPPPPAVNLHNSPNLPLTPPPTPIENEAPIQKSTNAHSLWAKYKYHKDQCKMNAITRASIRGSGSRMRERENRPTKNEDKNVKAHYYIIST
eukprot:TRINITY_DN4406_c0_g1_i1.p1 TRINITY_DN4406_c0_g1~~TRINITY_DN4406_c0_g1_i1.p1  ORF type:complete len:360 (+),score=78.89 TRINITY_DN4406_c0_g1_i1:850-1929(+)